jgi:hypothetical protein
MLGIGCPDRHALPRITSPKTRRPQPVVPPARAGSFFGAEVSSEVLAAATTRTARSVLRACPMADLAVKEVHRVAKRG